MNRCLCSFDSPQCEEGHMLFDKWFYTVTFQVECFTTWIKVPEEVQEMMFLFIRDYDQAYKEHVKANRMWHGRK